MEISCGAIDRGASLTFVSQYPGEGEMLYPPLSYLEVVKTPRYREVEGRQVKVLELKINANTMSLTIEDFVGKRKQLYVGLMENLAREDPGAAENSAMGLIVQVSSGSCSIDRGGVLGAGGGEQGEGGGVVQRRVKLQGGDRAVEPSQGHGDQQAQALDRRHSGRP
uniref:Uncharacterized protein n=2 Tax=Guillardia theta TaxID=55529 RepID=A0A7S4JJ92_GUITH